MTSSTSLEIGALGKNSKPLQPERLRDDDGESFGASRTSYAYRRKMQMRLAARIARDRNRASVIVLPKRDEGYEIHEPVSDEARELGIRSYQVEVADTSSIISGPTARAGRAIAISLPYVSILRATAIRTERDKG